MPSRGRVSTNRASVEVHGNSCGVGLERHPRRRPALLRGSGTLHEAGVHQVAISASEQANLLAQLAPFALDEWLDSAHGIEDIYAASKEGLARRWLANAQVDPANVVFVGDSEHDFEIAAAVGANRVLFSGGHHARAHLASIGVPVIDHLSQLPHLVTSLRSRKGSSPES